MRFLLTLIAALMPFTASATPAGSLDASKAAVVGGWTAPGLKAVQGIVLAPIALTDGCYRYTDDGLITIEDHAIAERPAFWKLYGLPAGRYALVGVEWMVGERFGNSHQGMSRQRGSLFTFEVRPGFVTDIGVWTITSPYPERYVVGTVDFETSRQAAQSLAEMEGPLMRGGLASMAVVHGRDPCPFGSGVPTVSPKP